VCDRLDDVAVNHGGQFALERLSQGNGDVAGSVHAERRHVRLEAYLIQAWHLADAGEDVWVLVFRLRRCCDASDLLRCRAADEFESFCFRSAEQWRRVTREHVDVRHNRRILQLKLNAFQDSVNGQL